VYAWWIDANKAAGRRVTKQGPDKAAAKQLAANVAAGELTADELRKCLADYLADDDRFVFKLGYALRHLPGRIDAYLNGSAKSQEAEPNAGAWER